MMGTVRVTVTWEGIDTAINRLTTIDEHAQENLVKLTAALARDTTTAWKAATPRRTGRLQEGDRSEVDGLSFMLLNEVYYYKFLDDPGHWTPRGWRTKHGYRVAKHRSHVAGRAITSKAVQFVEQNIEAYLSKFLDGV
jgi:hypothetical protein